MIVTTAAEMRALDRWTIEHGTPGHVLMERAGAGAAAALRRRFGKPGGLVVVVCGRGNNGGDGFVIARHLRRARWPVEVWLVGEPAAVQGDAARMLAAWRRAGGTVQPLREPAHLEALRRRLARAGLVVDALLGTGLNAPVTGHAAAVVQAANDAGPPIFAVDIASGLSADTGRALGIAIRAAATATFGAAKLGQCLHPGVEHTGALDVVDIGIPAEAVAAVAPRAQLLQPAAVGALLPRRAAESHKGTYGHLLIVAGSHGKTGAALLAAGAAVRAGAGLTTLAVPASVQPVIEGQVREAMTTVLPDPADAAAVDALLAGHQAVACGPGLGLDERTRALVTAVVRRCRAPLVLDADALNAVAGTSLLRERPGPTVLTPHPGEMARLLGTETAAVQDDRVAAVRRLAEQGGVAVLKGARTLVAAPDGALAICPTGNPGMASGGQGDVLTGITGALLSQRLTAWDAARFAVFVHGAAADAVVALRGTVGLTASDVILALPPAIRDLQEAARGGA